ncbi:MAG: glycosyltransferase family 4 protein [Planctomycetota bacterium]|jgi:glycosyltransferase involved in cell wall biosynthesis
MSSEAPFELVCCAAMHDSLLYHHLTPLAMDERVDRIWVVRHKECEYGEIPKAEYVLVPDRPRPLRWLKMLQQCVRLAKRPGVRAIVSFNPFPYGLLATPAARLAKKPIHYAFIGCDLNVHLNSLIGRVALSQLRRASLVTVPGNASAEKAISAGLPADRVRPIPHVVDLDHFVPPGESPDRRSLVAVGDLIRLKRFETLIRAMQQVVSRFRDARLTVVGDGPERQKLESLAVSLGVSESIAFTGRVSDVRPCLQQAAVFVCSSEREGFPRSMSEAIATGLVPVTTPVGAIPDYVEHGIHGLHFPVMDADSLAEQLIVLLSDPDEFLQIRNNVLKLRESFGYDSAATVWQDWLTSLDGVSKPDHVVSMAS